MSTEENSATGDDRGAIDRVRAAHVAALNSGDAEAFARVFAEDGVQMPPNAPANVGRDSIQSWIQGLLRAFSAKFALSVEEVRITGDWAFERGTYTITLTPKAGGGAIQDVGKYITVYHRSLGGVWATGRDIWNSDNPPPGMG
jgi:uncharacterized protein (TIGR02246 family)